MMRLRIAEILRIDTKKGQIEVRCFDNEELFNISKIGILLGGGDYFSGIFKYPEVGDRILLLQYDNDPYPIMIPISIPEDRATFENEDSEFYIVEFLHLINNLEAESGDYIIYGQNDNYIIVRSNGNIIFKSGFTKVLLSESLDIGGFYVDAINFMLRSHIDLFALKFLYDRSEGPSASFEINQPSSLSGSTPLVSFKSTKNRTTNFLTFEISRDNGDLHLYSDSFDVTIDSKGNLEYKTDGSNTINIKKDLNSKVDGKVTVEVKGDVNVKATNAVIDAQTVTLTKPPQSPVVTGFPDGTMPVCYVTGAPINGSQSCKAGK